MSIAAAEPTDEMRLAALAKANEVRTARAALKRDVKARRTSVAAIVLDPPSYAQAMRLGELVGAAHRVGRRKLARVLARTGLGAHQLVGELTERQRCELVGALAREGIR